MLLHRNVQWFRGGLVFKAHRLCVSLNSRLGSNKEEEKTGEAPQDMSGLGSHRSIQGYLAHKKQRRPRTLQYGCAQGLMVVLGRWAVSYERGTPVWRAESNGGPFTRRCLPAKLAAIFVEHIIRVNTAAGLYTHIIRVNTAAGPDTTLGRRA